MKKKLFKAVAFAMALSMINVNPVYATNITSLQNEKKKTESELSELEQQLATLLTEIDETEEKLIAKGEAVIEETKHLESAQELKEKQYEQMKLRIKYMYENGTDASAMVQVISMENMSDSLNQHEYVDKISTYDRNQLQAYVDNINDIENTITVLENEKTELEQLQAEYEAKQGEINDLISSKKKSIKDLDKKIDAAVKEAARKKAEEEAKKKALANNQNNNQNNNTNNNTGASLPSNSGSATGNQIVSLALQYVGTPYRSGGASPEGFDCSGFTSYIHAQFGISLSRSSSSQAYGGVAVSLSDIQPGDVVCYPGHVGIYIGNNQIVHATVPGSTVKVANIYYASYATIIAVRRYY